MLSRSCMPFTPSLMSLSFHTVKSVSLLRASSHALCVCEYPHHLWQRCQAGTYYLVTHLPCWQSPRHHPRLHWLHLQRGLQHFQLMLFANGPISHLHWLRIWLGTYLGTHCHCQTRNPDPNELDELEWLSLDPRLDAELSPEEEPDRECCGERDFVHVCVWMESMYCRRGSGGKTIQWECFGISLDLRGCCGGRCRWACPTVAAAPPPVLRMIASFKMSSAFLWLSKDGVCARFRLWSPNQGWA